MISESEAATIKVEQGKAPGTWLLTQRQKSVKGETVFKETVLDAVTKRIREHRVYASDNKTLLTSAVIKDYEEFPAASVAGEPPGKAYLPRWFVLSWAQEKMNLEIHMREVKVNRFEPSRRTAVFTEPERPGLGAEESRGTGPPVARQRLADVGPGDHAGPAAEGPAE